MFFIGFTGVNQRFIFKLCQVNISFIMSFDLVAFFLSEKYFYREAGFDR